MKRTRIGNAHTQTQSLGIVPDKRAMGIEPTSESWVLAPRAADTSQQFRSSRNEAQKRAGKKSTMDELKHCGEMKRSDSN
jgi:hypothetical protein